MTQEPREWERLLVPAAIIGMIGYRIGTRSTPASVPTDKSMNASMGSRGSGEAVEVLDGAILRRRSVDIFPGAYVTLLSIVQATALGLLAVQVNNLRKPVEWPSWAQAATALIAIVVVFYMYVWFILFVRWAPTFFDSLIPFGLGVSEIAIVQAVGQDHTFVLRAAILQLVGALAFAHSVWRTTSDLFDEPADHAKLRRLLQFLTVATAVGGMLAICIYVFVAETPVVGGLVAALLAATSVVLVLRSEATLAQIFDSHGLRFLRRRRISSITSTER